MDNSLHTLCEALKKIIWQLKPQHNALSFLLLTGKTGQGKSTLLRQSRFKHYAVDAEKGADIFYNKQGVIVELGESWLNQSKNLLQSTLKQLNKCHRSLKISGILLCVDINELITSEPLQFTELGRTHTQWLERFGSSLGYRVDTAIIFTKLDSLAGFCEFFQNDHVSELKKPLGFSIDWVTRQGKAANTYKIQFEQFLEMLGQQVINKLHPARSSIKRTLIRELPLQFASLRIAIQALIQTISPKLYCVRALYFTSGEQGGISLDRLNKKIQHEYALTVQDKFPQSVNHRAYFIEGALAALQSQTKQLAKGPELSHRWFFGLVASTMGLSVAWLGYHYFESSHLLNIANKEIRAYNDLRGQENLEGTALYHLSQASSTLNNINSNALSYPLIAQLQTEVQNNTKQRIQTSFLPSILAEIEQTMIDAGSSQIDRYQALKIYLMLSDRSKFSEADVLGWFHDHWQTKIHQDNLQKKLALLKENLSQPLPINHSIVSDVRNYLNALPLSYLYYSLAKSHFSMEKIPLNIEGFELASKEMPLYLTKKGFPDAVKKIASIAAQLQAENWVLARQDLTDLPTLLLQAYCYDYVSWWQNFMRRSSPLHAQDYQQARRLTQLMHQPQTLTALVTTVQEQLSPNVNEPTSLFNQEIASKFTELSLMGRSALRDVTMTMSELEKFLTTLGVVNDQGKTAFHLTKARFQGDNQFNPLSALYAHARQLPEPAASWTKQIADDIWFILINDCKNYINQQWQQTVVPSYQNTIAKRYPFDATERQEIAIADFDRFFGSHGILNSFVNDYLKPFLDTSQPQWELKPVDNYVLPISAETVNELIRANVINNMFFPEHGETSNIEFSLQKINLDPVVSHLQLIIGSTTLKDTQDSESHIRFHWPEANAKLTLNSIEGNHYELDEHGPWAFFKMLQKVNVLVDEQDSASLQILFEVNGNSGRYLLKTKNQVNPFTPGVLNGFFLPEAIA